ncbi:hypothetical protein [Parasediminibacterium sp. JCM 36343]
MSATELAYLKSGKCYVVLCSRAFSKGEIRGQIKLEKTVY